MADGTPRMSAEEADARFAALVAQYRDEQPAGARRGSSMSSRTSSVVLAVVYAAGVAAAWLSRGAPLLVVGLGVVVVVAARRILAWADRR